MFEASKKLYRETVETMSDEGDDKESGLLNGDEKKGTLDEDDPKSDDEEEKENKDAAMSAF